MQLHIALSKYVRTFLYCSYAYSLFLIPLQPKFIVPIKIRSAI